MAYYETLQYVDGSGSTQEVALSLANLATGPATVLKFTPSSITQGPGRFEITFTQPPETAIAIPFKSRCVVWARRSSSTGATNSFSGGTMLFQGRRTDNEGSAAADRVQTTVVLQDVIWDLERVTLQATWRVITGGTYYSPTYGTAQWPDCVLFQATPGASYTPSPVNSHITTWQTIVEILGYATSYASGTDAIKVQLNSSAEFTPAYVPWYTCRAVKVAEALRICLRAHPGVFTEIDYTTTPPTLHFRDRSHMTAVTLPYAETDGNGVMHIASDIQSLDTLVPDAVRLYYKTTSTINNAPVISLSTDIYPSGAGNSLLCLDYSLDVTGPAQQQVIYNFTSTAFDPTDLGLWRDRVPSLKQVSQGGQVPNDGSTGALTMVDANPYNSSTHPKGYQVVDESGNPITLTSYGYYTDMAVYDWLPVSGGAAVVKATLTAYFSYNKASSISGATVSSQVVEHQHSIRLVLTNVPSGTYIFQQTQNPGEAIPSGLAQALYTELSVLQWKLTHEVIQVGATSSAVPTLVKPGKNVINLANGASAWTSMNAAPERVTIQFYGVSGNLLAARHQIQCGPINHLQPDYILQLTNMFWNRQKSGIDPFQRLNGQVGSNQTDLTPTADAKENSIPAESFLTQDTYTFIDGSGNFWGASINAQDLSRNAALN